MTRLVTCPGEGSLGPHPTLVKSRNIHNDGGDRNRLHRRPDFERWFGGELEAAAGRVVHDPARSRNLIPQMIGRHEVTLRPRPRPPLGEFNDIT
ncbi:hypothetical protein GCM10009555_088470 [Acrocarpospora macrocephala]|uniref:Uncharacterized protein n=1 Tax=Acrocarpospora macrocephala TaxID=150177 RepID=A0A5M3X368_9ACTN|nr:hypothetical protein Amac_076580 [Acrocarpospora macrocephala]